MDRECFLFQGVLVEIWHVSHSLKDSVPASLKNGIWTSGTPTANRFGCDSQLACPLPCKNSSQQQPPEQNQQEQQSQQQHPTRTPEPVVGFTYSRFFWAVCHVFIFSSGLITPWHDLNSSRIGFLPRLRTIRCCCLEDWFGAMGDGQVRTNPKSTRHFGKCVGIGGLGKSGIHPKLNLNNLGWSDVTKGSTEEGFHEVFLRMYSFQLYVWVGMFSLPATRVTVAFLVGELSSCSSVGVHLNVSGCYVSFPRVKRMICWHPQKVNWCPRHVNNDLNLAYLISLMGISRPSFMYGIWQADMRIFFHQPNALRCHKHSFKTWSCNYRK